MPATEEIQVTICKVSRPTSLGRFTAKHVPIPVSYTHLTLPTNREE